MDVHKIDVGRMQSLSPAPRSKKEAASMDLAAQKKAIRRETAITYIIYTLIPALALLGCVAVLYFIACLFLAVFGVL